MKAEVTSQAKTLFTTLSRLGHLGNIILLVQTERNLWQGDWASLINPLFHLEALGLLIRNPVFWLFLGVAIASAYAINQIEQEDRRQKLQTTTQGPETPVPVEAAAKTTSQTQDQAQAKTQPQTQVQVQTQAKTQASREPQPRQELQTQEKIAQKPEPPQPSPPKKATVKKKSRAEEKVDPVVQKTLQWAIESSQKVRFRYRDSDDTTNHYVVTLIKFKTITDQLYVEAKYAFKKPARSFKIARIDQVEFLAPQHFNYSSPVGSTLEQPVAKQPVAEQPVEQAPVQPKPITAPPPTPYVEPSIATTAEATVEAPAQETPIPVQPNRVAIAQPPTAPEPDRPSKPKRLYLKKSSHELRSIIQAEWDNPNKLSEIEYELSFRSRRAALKLHEQVSARLSRLQNRPLAWSTVASPSSMPLENNRFRQKRGLLREYGYKVGEMGLSIQERRAILDRICLTPLQAEGQTPDWEDYLAEWGKPRTEKRLKKLAACLAAFSRNAKRRDPEGMAQAIRDWEDDLNYLKRKYAVG